MNSTTLIAISSSLTALSAVAGIFFGASPYLKYGAIVVVVISTIITIFQARLAERDGSFTKRCLSNLIRSVRPSEYVRNAIFDAVHTEAKRLGMPVMHIVGFESQKYILGFSNSKEGKRVGVLCLAPEDISGLSLYDAKEFPVEVNKLICCKYNGKALNGCWEELKKEITLVSELVFAHHRQRSSTVKIWENLDEKYIAVGPPDCPDDTPPHERAEFQKAALQDLVRMDALKRGAIIADSAERLVHL